MSDLIDSTRCPTRERRSGRVTQATGWARSTTHYARDIRSQPNGTYELREVYPEWDPDRVLYDLVILHPAKGQIYIRWDQ